MKLLVENPNELIEERYYTEKDMLRIVGNVNQNAQQKYELEIGDILYFNKDNKCFDADYKTQNQIIDDLKREVAKLKRDNDILKKTISLLAKKD